MELTAGSVVIAAVVGLLGLFGWSHKSIKDRLDLMEVELYKRPNFHDVRDMFKDKMAPFQSEYNSLTRRFDELKAENDKMNEKIDELLIICTKLSNQK